MQGGKKTTIDPAKLAQRAQGKTLADSLKNKAASAKRAATALRGVVADVGAELGVAERASLEQALQTLGTVAAAYQHAHQIRQRMDAQQEARTKEATAIIRRLFGQFETVEDKVALIATQHPWLLDAAKLERIQFGGDKGEMHARWLLTDEYEDTIRSMAYSVAKHDGDMEAFAAEGLAKFQDKREALQLKHATLIVAINQVVRAN